MTFFFRLFCLKIQESQIVPDSETLPSVSSPSPLSEKKIQEKLHPPISNSFNSKSTIRKRLLSFPITKKKISGKKTSLFCFVCHTEFPSMNSFLVHNNFHSDKFECSICKIRFDSLSSLKSHRMLHEMGFRMGRADVNSSTDQKKVFQCCYCRRVFLKSDSFDLHMALHLNCF